MIRIEISTTNKKKKKNKKNWNEKQRQQQNRVVVNKTEKRIKKKDYVCMCNSTRKTCTKYLTFIETWFKN